MQVRRQTLPSVNKTVTKTVIQDRSNNQMEIKKQANQTKNVSEFIQKTTETLSI